VGVTLALDTYELANFQVYLKRYARFTIFDAQFLYIIFLHKQLSSAYSTKCILVSGLIKKKWNGGQYSLKTIHVRIMTEVQTH